MKGYIVVTPSPTGGWVLVTSRVYPCEEFARRDYPDTRDYTVLSVKLPDHPDQKKASEVRNELSRLF